MYYLRRKSGLWVPDTRLVRPSFPRQRNFLPGHHPAAGAAPLSDELEVSLTDFATSTVEEPSGATFTFSNVSIGGAHPERRVFVVFSWFGTGDFYSSSAIGGGAATTHAVFTDSEDDSHCAIVSRAVASGATADVSLTTASTAFWVAIGVFRAINLTNSSPTDTDTDGSNSGTPSMSVNVPSGGFVIAGLSWETDPVGSTTWSGVTEDYDDNSGTFVYSGGHAGPGLASETGRSVSATISNEDFVGAAACLSWV